MENSEMHGPIDRDHIRTIPPGFGWIDHRFVRGGYIDKCTNESLSLYLFLVTVSDSQGVSWWKDGNIAQRLGISAQDVRKARIELIQAKLLVFEEGTWQLLPLEGI